MREFIRPNIRAMAGYVPGEQPRDGGFIKLNTNENPYPPSPRVFEAIQQALAADRLCKYPDPLGTNFRMAASRVLGIDPDSILIGNGSDDILTILARAFVPQGGLVVAPTPSYLLYRSLAEIQGAGCEFIPFMPDWSLDFNACPKADLTFLANPNSPSGTAIAKWTLTHRPQDGGPLIIDEAYADFADEHCLELPLQCDSVIVTRSLSKSYSLAGIRFGFAVAKPGVVHELNKVKDSYNCDVLSLAAATAAIEDQDHMLANRAKILATRRRLIPALRSLGFETLESQANFVWCRRSDQPVKPIYEELKRRGVLIRYMKYAGYGDGLRITVGTDGEIDKLLMELNAIV